MKLNPPASSSDLDEARAVARRLHQRATGQEVTAGQDDARSPAPSPLGAVPRPNAPGRVEPEARRPEPQAPPPEPPPAPARVELADPYPEPDEDELEVATDDDVTVEEPALSPGEAPGDFETTAAEPEASGPVLDEDEDEDEDEETDLAEASGSNPFQPGPFEISVPGLEDDDEEAPVEDDGATVEATGAEPFEPQLEVAAEDLATSPEEPTTFTDSASPEEAPAPESAPPPDPWEPEPWEPAPEPEGPAPGDDALSALTEGAPEPTFEEIEAPADSVSPEDLVSGWGAESPVEELQASELEPATAPDDLPPPPSWDDLADACLVAARAHGAMMVDPTGQVVTARGQWPEPGPEAIGRRLVAMMEKTLADAPTRSVSAPLAGEHLTAWRVPVAEGFMTVVFMAETTLDNDARAAVDAEVHRTLGQ